MIYSKPFFLKGTACFVGDSWKSHINLRKDAVPKKPKVSFFVSISGRMWQDAFRIHKHTVKTTRLESHSSLVDSFGLAAVIRACASATRWRRAIVAWHFFGVTWRMIGAFSLQAFCQMMFLKEVFSSYNASQWMVDRCSCEGVASENRDLISEELLFLARFLAVS